MQIAIKRVYEKPDASDGYRVLVDRIWPRGMKKEEAHVHEWLKDIAPSDALRKWFAHDPQKWKVFQEKYEAELKEHESQLKDLLKKAQPYGKLTLLFGAKDEKHNQALVLQQVMQKFISARHL
ncbi:uncharacterized protein YeaO (DUF488 family) [Thermoflavifilum aggregans]|uniref:Uncharacterized protein YeaO (DUF488 family) n=1 Tax=Thermoflavifilum aggregans TaxID=454188 RepID=A0A2M9CV14_9BACT|nr:DUF488 domain-containing protein [Thermoflavifilum aggregans]PJJ75764.1 uncharacterized protein YeaO (DUF488 family) [Thermoflavifilum aggregans]